MPSYYWEVLALGVDVATCVLLHTLYKRSTQDSEFVKAAPSIDTGQELKTAFEASNGQALPYACVSGKTTPMNSSEVLHSRYASSEKGIIQKVTMLEHRARRTQGYWSDISRVLRDTTNTVPFLLQTPDGSTVEVTEPLSAEYIQDALKVTHNHFEPAKSSLPERMLDRLFGDVPRGVQESEEMLGIGVPLLGVGRLVLHNSRPKLMLPEDGRKYILTTMTRRELLKTLQSRARFFKGMLLVFGALGMGLVIYWTYKLCVKWKEDSDMRRALEEFRQQRQGSLEGAGDNGNTDQQCVVCLNNLREVVLLDCGHVCLCSNCAQALPDPKACPICRNRVSRIIPIYVA